MNFGPLYFSGSGTGQNKTLIKSALYWRLHKDLEWTIEKLSLEKQFPVHKGCVNSLCWNSTGQYLLSGSDDRNLVISSPFSPKLEALKIFSGHQANIFSAKFLPHSGDKNIISASGDGRVSLADLGVAAGLEGFRTFASHHGAVYDLVTSRWDPGVFFSVGSDGTIRQFDVRQSHCSSSLLLNNQNMSQSGFTAAALHPSGSGRRMFVSDCNGCILEFDRRFLPPSQIDWANNTACLSLTEPPRSDISASSVGANVANRVSSLEFDQLGERLLASYSCGRICLFDVSRHFEDTACQPNFTRDSNWQSRANVGYALLEQFRGHRNSRTSIQQATFWGVSHILSGSDCGHIFAWRIGNSPSTGSPCLALQADRCLVNRVAANPELLCLATSGVEHLVKLWSPMQHSETDESNEARLSHKSNAAIYAEEIARRNQELLGYPTVNFTMASLNHFALPPAAAVAAVAAAGL